MAYLSVGFVNCRIGATAQPLSENEISQFRWGEARSHDDDVHSCIKVAVDPFTAAKCTRTYIEEVSLFHSIIATKAMLNVTSDQTGVKQERLQ